MPEERKKAFLEKQKLIRSLSSGYYEEHCTFIEHCIDVPDYGDGDEVSFVELYCWVEVEEDCFDDTDPNCSNYDICAVDPCACDNNCDDDILEEEDNCNIVCKFWETLDKELCVCVPNHEEEKPCSGDPVPNPEIAPQTNSGINGGRYGNTRSGGSQFHGGLDLKSKFDKDGNAKHN